MGFDYDLAKGFALLLAGAGIGVWAEDRAYTSAETGIYYRSVPDSPARIITLSPYPVEDAVNLSTVTAGLQIRVRGGDSSPKSCDDLAGSIYDLLQGRRNFELPTGLYVAQTYRQSGASLGQDSARRWSHSDNYYCDVRRPSTHRP